MEVERHNLPFNLLLNKMNTFRKESNVITTSLTERTIYVKIVNNQSYTCYEGNFDQAAFKLPFELADIHKLVNKCFVDEPEAGYEVRMELDNSVLRLSFRAVVGGFLNVAFTVLLREKLMSNDAQLSVNIHRIEQTYQAAIEEMMRRMEEMERRLEALGHADICFTEPPSSQSQYVRSYPIDSKSIEINDSGNHVNQKSFEKVKYFYQLKELTLINCQWGHVPKIVSNKTVRKLTIKEAPTFKDIAFIQNFPALEELSMLSVAMDASIVSTLRSISHKITKLNFKSCSGLNQTEMQTYCTQTGIELNLS